MRDADTDADADVQARTRLGPSIVLPDADADVQAGPPSRRQNVPDANPDGDTDADGNADADGLRLLYADADALPDGNADAGRGCGDADTYPPAHGLVSGTVLT